MSSLRVVKILIVSGFGGTIVGGLIGWPWIATALLAAVGGMALGFMSAIYFFAKGLVNENPKLMNSIMMARLLSRRGRAKWGG